MPKVDDAEVHVVQVVLVRQTPGAAKQLRAIQLPQQLQPLLPTPLRPILLRPILLLAKELREAKRLPRQARVRGELNAGEVEEVAAVSVEDAPPRQERTVFSLLSTAKNTRKSFASSPIRICQF